MDNLFNVEEEYFLIDSEGLDSVQTKLYGYCILEDEIINSTCKQVPEISSLTGRGAYVLVRSSSEKIQIYQDFLGCYGLYLFRNGDYFALSNSFLRLEEFIKTRFPISMNWDYANHFLVAGLSSFAYSETIISEIQMLPRNAIVEICRANRTLLISHMDYSEDTVDLDSDEGFALLDRWYHRWTGLFRSIKEQTGCIRVDLSGGFDSRTVFMLALHSGINLNEIMIMSSTSKGHTFSEDYKIASQIVDYYGLQLNRTLPVSQCNFTLDDLINISFYTKLTFHSQMFYHFKKSQESVFQFAGFCGEYIRKYYNYTPDSFARKAIRAANVYPYQEREAIGVSVRAVLSRTIAELNHDYGLDASDAASLGHLLWRETKGRNHHAKEHVEFYHANIITMAPLGDPDLQKLKIHHADLQDENLLTAVLFTRYGRELLNFPFNGNRKIDEKTLAYAEQINQKYPFHEEAEQRFTLSRISVKSTDSEHETMTFNRDDIERYILKLCKSTKFRNTFTKYYSDQIYRDALAFYDSNRTTYHQPLQKCYTMIGITKMLDDVAANENLFSPTVKDGLDRLASGRPMADLWDVMDKLSDDLLARFEFKILDCDESDLNILSISDPVADVRRPAWFQKNGTGIVVESRQLSIDVTLHCVTSGTLEVKLGGRKDHKNQIAHWIDFLIVQLDGTDMIHERTSAWYDSPIICEKAVCAGDDVRMHIEWDLFRRFHSN